MECSNSISGLNCRDTQPPETQTSGDHPRDAHLTRSPQEARAGAPTVLRASVRSDVFAANTCTVLSEVHSMVDA